MRRHADILLLSLLLALIPGLAWLLAELWPLATWAAGAARAALLAAPWPPLGALAGMALAALVAARTRRRRPLAYVGQTAQRFTRAADRGTRAANERVLAGLAAQGLRVPGFSAQSDPAERVRRHLEGQGDAGATEDEVAASQGLPRRQVRLILRQLGRGGEVATRAHGRSRRYVRVTRGEAV